MRLVKKRTENLSEEATKRLLELVQMSIRNDSEFFDKCRRLREKFKGNQWDKSGKQDRHEIVANVAYSHIRSIVPTVFYKEPTVQTWTDNPQYRASSSVWQSLINKILRETKYKRPTKKVVLDGHVYPEGWKKWLYVKEEEEQDIETGVAELEEGSEPSGSLSEAQPGGPEGWNANGTPVGVRLSPLQVIVDYNSSDRSLEEARFVAVRYRRLLSELKADSRYTIPKDWKPPVAPGVEGTTKVSPLGSRNSQVDWWDEERGSKFTPLSDEYVTIYEVWVYQLVQEDSYGPGFTGLFRQMVVLMEDYEKPIRGPLPWEDFVGPFLKTYPFTRITFNDIPDDVPKAEIETWNSLQDALNLGLSELLENLCNQRKAYEIRREAFKNPDKAMQQLESNKKRLHIEVKDDSSVPPGSAVTPIQDHNTTQQDYQFIGIIEGMIQRISRLGQNRQGAAGIRTATEASIIEQGVQINTDERVDIVNDYCLDDINIMLKIARHVLKPGFVFRVIGDTGAVKWARFTEFDASWCPEIEIQVDSFRKATDEQQISNLMRGYAMAQQLFAIYGPQVKLDVFLKRLLDKLNIHNPDEIISNQLPQEIQQMSEIIAMIAGMPVEVNPTDNDSIHLGVLNMIKNNPQVYDNLPPQAREAIDEHEIMHQQQLAQRQAQAQSVSSSGSNPFDNFSNNGEAATPAATANRETSAEREAVSSYPLGGGQL